MEMIDEGLTDLIHKYLTKNRNTIHHTIPQCAKELTELITRYQNPLIWREE